MSASRTKSAAIVPVAVPDVPFVPSIHDVAARIAALPDVKARRERIAAFQRRHGPDQAEMLRASVAAAWRRREKAAA